VQEWRNLKASLESTANIIWSRKYTSSKIIFLVPVDIEIDLKESQHRFLIYQVSCILPVQNYAIFFKVFGNHAHSSKCAWVKFREKDTGQLCGLLFLLGRSKDSIFKPCLPFMELISKSYSKHSFLP
jgi:hypothetical protein